jgi:hypothetical protein
MEQDSDRISRRRMLMRLGLGTAVVTLAPIVTGLGADALASCGYGCSDPCDWTCGQTVRQCGGGCGPLGAAYCSPDVDGYCFCWEDWFCSEVSDCTENSDCPPGYACIPGTCCGTSKCLPGCGIGARSRQRHGKLSSGAVR